MKLKIGEYNVTITAQPDKTNKMSFSRNSTLIFLNELCIFLSEASEAYQKNEYQALANWSRNWKRDIHKFLEEKNFFD